MERTGALFRDELDGLDEDLQLRLERVQDDLLMVEPLRGTWPQSSGTSYEDAGEKERTSSRS